MKASNFYVRSSLFGILSLTGAVLNYALYPILVRALNTTDFGDFAVIVALSNQLLGILLAFNIISIYLVKTQPENDARRHAQIIQKVLIGLLVVATLLMLVLSPYLNNLLQVQNNGLFVVLSLILLTSVPVVIWSGYLQGHKEMIRVGGFNLAAALGKLVFASILAILFGAIGGLLGILVGTIVGLFVMWLVPGVKLPSLKSLFTKSAPEEKRFLLGLKKYFIECLVVVGVLSFLQNYDILLAKSLFDPSVAGVYSGISILGNALYYLCFLLIWIVLPEIKINDDANNRRLLSTAYKLMGALTVVVISVEFALRDYLTRLLLGANFADQGNLLIFATLYQLTLVSITLYAYYLLVNRRRRAGLLAVFITASCATVPLFSVSTPLEMIRTLWLALLAGFGVYLFSLVLMKAQAARSRRT